MEGWVGDDLQVAVAGLPCPGLTIPVYRDSFRPGTPLRSSLEKTGITFMALEFNTRL